jgi:putative hemolysin
VAEQSETGEEAVDSLTEGLCELPGGREEEEVVYVR